MTICIAALAANHTIVGASDRMLTAGDIQFQPPQMKVFIFSNSIVALVSGDIFLGTEVLTAVERLVQQRINSDPNNWWLLEDVASLYAARFSAVLKERAFESILLPLGFERKDWPANLKDLSPSTARVLIDDLKMFELPTVEVILAGVDPTGAHLYTCRGVRVQCVDAVGYAVVGSGAWHAESALIAAGHSRNSPFSKAFYDVYAAKRRAEVAPGVGVHTDTFTIGPQLGSYSNVRIDAVEFVEKLYNENVQQDLKQSIATAEKMATFTDSLTTPDVEKAQKPADSEAIEGEPVQKMFKL